MAATASETNMLEIPVGSTVADTSCSYAGFRSGIR